MAAGRVGGRGAGAAGLLGVSARVWRVGRGVAGQGAAAGGGPRAQLALGWLAPACPAAALLSAVCFQLKKQQKGMFKQHRRVPAPWLTRDVEALVPLLHDPVLGQEGALRHAVHLRRDRRYGTGQDGSARVWGGSGGERVGWGAAGGPGAGLRPRAAGRRRRHTAQRRPALGALPTTHSTHRPQYTPATLHARPHLLREAGACVHDDGPQVAAGADRGDGQPVVKALADVHVQPVVAHVVVVAAGKVGGDGGRQGRQAGVSWVSGGGAGLACTAPASPPLLHPMGVCQRSGRLTAASWARACCTR